MRESLPGIPISAPERVARPPQEGIPCTKAERDGLLAIVRQYVQANELVPPLSLDELQEHADRIARITNLADECRKYTLVLVNNEAWRERLAGIPYNRRLLLLPKCLRSAEHCAGEMDEVGLICNACGRCCIRDLQAEAERLGYVVLIAEGSPVVMSLLETNQVEAVIGVSCLSVLESVFPYMQAGAVPGIAIPILYDGCRNTAVDLDWVWEAIHLTSADKTRRLDLEALRRQVSGWFTPEGLRETLGQPHSETERIARQWLVRSGKRWRPFLAVCAYKALHHDVETPVPDDFRKVAVAVECFHKASLVHDDIEDGDETRYSQKTLHAEYGVPVALNAGDLLLGEGYRLIAECGAPTARKVEMFRAAAEGHRTLCLGQGAELCWRRRPTPLSSDEVLDIFQRKTAPAFDVALHLGAMYAGAGENIWEVLASYSQALGIAYQIRDDLADFTDGPDGSDVETARPSLLLAIAYESATGQAKGRLEDIWRQSAGADARAAEVKQILAKTDVVQRTRQLLESYKQLAVRSLGPLGNANLKGLLRRVITRIFNDTEIMGCCNDYQRRNARERQAGEGTSAPAAGPGR